MKSGNDDKRLDEILHDALGSTEAKLDFAAWKAGHADEMATFRSQPVSAKEQTGRMNVFGALLASRITKLAVAACLIIAAGLILQIMNTPQEQDAYAPSPAAMMNRLQLTLAYAEGGIDAVDAQYEQAYAKLGPRAGAVSIDNVFNEF